MKKMIMKTTKKDYGKEKKCNEKKMEMPNNLQIPMSGYMKSNVRIQAKSR